MDQLGINFIIRGIRSEEDYKYERCFYEELISKKNIEIIYFLSQIYISSTKVRNNL